MSSAFVMSVGSLMLKIFAPLKRNVFSPTFDFTLGNKNLLLCLEEAYECSQI